MIKVNKKANPGKDLSIKIDNNEYLRFPISTHLIHIKEDLTPILEGIKKEYQEGDWIAISEKFLTISEGRLIHKSFLKPGYLAKALYWVIRFNMGEKAYKNDPGHAVPEKLQAAILIAGWWRMFFAMLIGVPLTLLWKIFGKRKGWFYILAGNRISEIDGTFTDEMPPFNEFAKIYPENAPKSAQKIKDKFGIATAITDGNNINTEILGVSNNFPVSRELAREILLDNPMGQGKELTPIILVRKK